MGTRLIPLTQGMFAIVDEGDYGHLSRFKWFAHKERNTFYALRNRSIKGGGKRALIAMHREILGISDTSVRIDHEDGNGLNNSRSNIRIATNIHNLWNRRPDRRNRSGIKGVGFHRKAGKWRARIRTVEGKELHLGLFISKKDATDAYIEAALKHRGEFAGIDKLESVSIVTG